MLLGPCCWWLIWPFQNDAKMTETHGTHLRVLSKSALKNTNMTGFRLFSKIFAPLCFGLK